MFEELYYDGQPMIDCW